MSVPRIGPEDPPDVRRPKRPSPVKAASLGIVLGLVWQAAWAMFPEWQLPINGVAVYLVYRLLTWANR